MTIKDIARLAGVSHSTVSRSLNDSPLIHPETKERVKAIARSKGYEVNAIARSLSRGKTSCIALIYPEYFELPSIRIFFVSLLSHIQHVFEREMIDIMVSFPKNLHSGASSIQKLARERKIDGMLIVNNEIDADDIVCLEEARIPFVFLHKHPPEADVARVDFFCTDHAAGGRLAGERLLALGRRRLLCVSAIGEEFDARTEGFASALSTVDIGFDTSSILYGDCSFDFGLEVALQRVADSRKGSGQGIDGVFCQTDLMALGLIQGLEKAGIRVPEDVSVVGYDDIELGSYFSPSLSTIHQPLGEIAALACERLIELLSGKGAAQPEHRLIAPSLVVRES